MPKFSDTRRAQHRAEDMFALVADAERYPEFLPLCEALVIRQKKEREGATLLIADMTVGYKAIRETFTSQVLLKPAEFAIDVAYLDGPFSRLDNRWRFAPAGEGACDVHFFIDYEFRNKVLGTLMGAMFDRAFHRFSQAFAERADAIYGGGPA
ncbi:MAG: type II toxin-antitoxin system RatA family toxin [Phyllobacteriaceae bacterium]|nr:type II toxin-antitoxin system RatA family toxin [Phyllobacteriaceae bacterium]